MLSVPGVIVEDLVLVTGIVGLDVPDRGIDTAEDPGNTLQNSPVGSHIVIG